MRPSIEHRAGRRLDTDVGVRFVALPATIGSGRLTNVSLTGAFMETASKLNLAAVLYIEGLDSNKECDSDGAARRLAATVVRRCSAGVGLKWCAPCENPLPESGAAAAESAPAEVEETDEALGPGRRLYRLEFID